MSSLSKVVIFALLVIVFFYIGGNPSSPFSSQQSSMDPQTMGDHFVTSDGSSVNQDLFAQYPYVLLYFSASWCGPCQRFTPTLVNFYQKQNQPEKRFEIVFVSGDRSERDMFEYMEKKGMDFLAIPFNDARRQSLKQQHNIRGIPSLVLLNQQGKVVSSSFQGGNYVGTEKVLEDLQSLLD